MNAPGKGAVVSICRTKDPLRVQPELLASILRGEKPARIGRSRRLFELSPDDTAVLVFWTKDPSPMLACPELNEALAVYLRAGVLLHLHCTITSFGGTMLEPGVPSWEEVCSSIESIVERGLVRPDLISWRLDPLMSLVHPHHGRFDNTVPATIAPIAERLSRIGVRRCIVSFLDLSYRAAALRMEEYGFEQAVPAGAGEREAVVRSIERLLRAFGMSLQVCAQPEPSPRDRTERGCICSELYIAHGAALGGKYLLPHNEATGGQRPACKCTYSLDIGYTSGLKHCFSFGTGCLYCYSGRGRRPAPWRELREAEQSFTRMKREEYV